MADVSKRAALIVKAGKLRFGDTRWQSPMARLTKLSPSFFQKMESDVDPRGVGDEKYRQIAMALLKEADRSRATAEKLDKLAGAMLRELEQEK
jgi:hypothetical protein